MKKYNSTAHIVFFIVALYCYGYGQKALSVTADKLYNPFDTLSYTSVVVYQFADKDALLRYKKIPSVVTRDNALHPSVAIPGKKLSSEEIEELLSIVADTATYGGSDVFCYQPHIGFVFYSADDVIVGTINICLECDKVNSVPYVPARDYYNQTVDGDVFPQNTLSAAGKKRLIELCCKKLSLTTEGCD